MSYYDYNVKVGLEFIRKVTADTSLAAIEKTCDAIRRGEVEIKVSHICEIHTTQIGRKGSE